jgi:hypothetical protein
VGRERTVNHSATSQGSTTLTKIAGALGLAFEVTDSSSNIADA